MKKSLSEKNDIKRSGRQSNIELLRIVSMMMVVAVHIDGASLGLPSLGGDLSALDQRSAWQLTVESLTIIGVNCFTLISGYFGIRLRWRSAAAFLFECMFYAFGIYLMLCILHRQSFTAAGAAESLMVLTHTDLWYVPAYFLLMLLAPLINAGFESLPPRRAALLTGAIVLFNVWAGWLWEGNFNPTGYTISQLIMIYCIGRLIALYRSRLIDTLRHPAALYAAIYLLGSLATALMACYVPTKAFAYNQPAVIIASAALFLCFASMNFRSRAINLIARSAFAVYLIHKAPPVWGGLMRPMVRHLWADLSLTEFTLAALLMICAFFLLAMILDPVRRYVSRLLFR